MNRKEQRIILVSSIINILGLTAFFLSLLFSFCYLSSVSKTLLNDTPLHLIIEFFWTRYAVGYLGMRIGVFLVLATNRYTQQQIKKYVFWLLVLFSIFSIIWGASNIYDGRMVLWVESGFSLFVKKHWNYISK